MGCNSQCKCQFNWPLDTQGLKRDPISSEKAWLDYAVRLLSREASGRGRGQESVWGAACKPAWWDFEVGLPWKNPTANPKDTKATLQKKYEALQKHLRVEGRFPNEMEEEARLWSNGNHKEMYLLTSLTSLLGRVSSVHSAAIETRYKSKELKVEIGQSLLQDIKICLNATLKEIEKIEHPDTSATHKRKHSHDIDVVVPKKMSKNVATSSASAILVSPQEPLKLGIASEISNLSTKLLDKHRLIKKKIVDKSKGKQSDNISKLNDATTTSSVYVTNSASASQMSSSSSTMLSSSVCHNNCNENILTVDSINFKTDPPCQEAISFTPSEAATCTNISETPCNSNSNLNWSTFAVLNHNCDANYLSQNGIVFSLVPPDISKQKQSNLDISDDSDYLLNPDKMSISKNTTSPHLDNALNSPSRLSIDSETSTTSLKTSDHGYNSDENLSALDFLDEFLNSDESSEIFNNDTSFFDNCFDDFESLS